MDLSRETNNKDCTMNSLPMLVSLIETAIKEKNIDKMYGDFLEKALKIGLSSYTLNILIVNAKNRIENSDTDYNDDLIIPFVYRPDIIKPKPEIKDIHEAQKEISIKNKEGYGFIISLIIILLLNVGIIALICHWSTKNLIGTSESLSFVKSQISKIRRIAQIGDTPTKSFEPWTSTNKEHNSKSNKDYSFTIKQGDKLYFDYNVSSEYGYDKLNVYLYTHSDTMNLLTVSGIKSGTKTYTFNNGGDVVARFEYSKDRSSHREKDTVRYINSPDTIDSDSSFHRNNDMVKISNIKIYKPYKVQINEIKNILNMD